ncbi:MAG: hypothetical protein JWO06_661 [Bacteroidota bacterium]|nr:hypothetical protein [Bacteroidota bacterium]
MLSAFSSNAQQQFPDNIYPDTVFAPFYYSVASGDPLQDRIIIWTKVYVSDSVIKEVQLKWQMAEDSSFTKLINSGETVCSVVHDFTTKVDVTGLQADHHYFYRFSTREGKVSQVGKAQTLPGEGAKHFKLALVSCSSVWSGYFNAYRRISERDDIDFVVHVGDYIYDFVDRHEKLRVPVPYPEEPFDLSSWRERHKYYLLDPDLRAARQNKTWIAEWDNHDTHYKHREKGIEGIQAFYEYLPIRMPDTSHPERIYRTFHFGGLADLNMIDMYMFRDKEDYETGKNSILGNVQDKWFKNELLTSKATWHLIGNQEMMGSWRSDGAPKFLHLPGNGIYFDPKGWDGHNDDRNRLYHFIDSNHINNFVVLSGDMHMSFVIDLTSEPKDKSVYNKHTGKGAVGVEVLGSSISRGGMAEKKGIPHFVLPLIENMSRHLNPHHLWDHFRDHGYVTVDVTKDRCISEFWYSPILKRSDTEKFGRGFTVKNSVNHWEHKSNRKKRKSTHP